MVTAHPAFAGYQPLLGKKLQFWIHKNMITSTSNNLTEMTETLRDEGSEQRGKKLTKGCDCIDIELAEFDHDPYPMALLNAFLKNTILLLIF